MDLNEVKINIDDSLYKILKEYFTNNEKAENILNNSEYRNQSFVTVEGIAKGSLPFRELIGHKLVFPNEDLIRYSQSTNSKPQFI